jgi:hypothetical protein
MEGGVAGAAAAEEVLGERRGVDEAGRGGGALRMAAASAAARADSSCGCGRVRRSGEVSGKGRGGDAKQGEKRGMEIWLEEGLGEGRRVEGRGGLRGGEGRRVRGGGLGEGRGDQGRVRWREGRGGDL